MGVMRIDVHDSTTWPEVHNFRQVSTPNGWQAMVCKIEAPFILIDGEKRSIFHNGYLLKTPVVLTAFPCDTFHALYPNYPRELS